MLIGILSDTHNQSRRTAAAIQLLEAEGAQVLFHCGDLTLPDIIGTCAVMPCYFVFGNNDVDRVDEIQAEINQFDGAVCLGWGGDVELAGKRIAMTHGHLSKEYRRLLATNPDYLFLGHSHFAADHREGVTRIINPGALHRAQEFTVALLNLENQNLKFLPVSA
ncbi:MAG: metallophosphoesterase family protein [Schlesneria sp.]